MASSVTLTAQDERDTNRLGAVLADVLPPGTVVGLIGTLGAGKTRLVQAVCAALGVPPNSVTSPTFVLVNEYTDGRVPVYHFDSYRLKDENEFLALGPHEYFDAGGLTFVEWADRVADLLPSDRLELTMEITGETQRRITLRGSSPSVEELLAEIATACGLAG